MKSVLVLSQVLRDKTICSPFLSTHRTQLKYRLRLNTGNPASTVRAHSTSLDAIDPYSYTSGQWLKANQEQHRLRHVKFNFSALCNEVVRCCPGASHVSSCEKKEGGFNRVFIMSLDDGERIVARIPFPHAGPRCLTTSSEVATMRYLRSKTSTPIPKVLAWSDDASTPVGCEYIIMEHVPGVQLLRRWPAMDAVQRFECTKALGMITRDIAELPFPAYGCIYPADSTCIPDTAKISLDPDFCIGPYYSRPFWDSTNGDKYNYSEQTGSDHGPFRNLSQYSMSLLRLGRARVSHNELEARLFLYHGSSAEREALLSDTQPVLEQLIGLPQIQEAAEPTMMHFDLHKRNVYVSDTDPTIITGVIDWQSTSIDPGFMYANEEPDFTLPLPVYDSGGDDSAAPDEAQQKDIEIARICAATFEDHLQIVPKIGHGRTLDKNLLLPFRYVATSHNDGVAPCRQALIELSQKWNCDFGLPGKCAYQPSAEQLDRNKSQYEDFETAMTFRSILAGVLMTNSEGWVSNDAWSHAKGVNKLLFDAWMEATAETRECTPEEAKDMYPFDEMEE